MSDDEKPDELELSEEEVTRRTRAALGPKKPKTAERLRRHKERKKEARDILKTFNIQRPITRAKPSDLKVINEIKAEFVHTWDNVFAKFDNFKHFNLRQQRLAKYYAQNGRTSVLNAAIRAGYGSKHAPNLINVAKSTMKRPGFEELVQAYEFEGKAKMKIAVEDVVKWFNDIATAAMASSDFTNANRAMENLAKYLGMFVEKKEVTHRMVHNQQELDARIAELTAVLREAEPEIEARLRTH